MSGKRIKNVLYKEWRVIFSSLSNSLFVTLIPLLIVAQGILYIWLAEHFGGTEIISSPLFQSALEKLKAAVPATQSLAIEQQVQALLLNQFNFYLLLIPTMIASSFAAFGIVEEKISHSLEPLLATPVKTWELLLGKALSGAIPALIMTWICAVIFLLGETILGWGELIIVVITPVWFETLFLLTPAITVLAFVLGVIGSSRAKDARSAQNITPLIIFPLFALIAIQVTGLIWFDTFLTLILAVILFAIDYIMLRLAVRLFQRESIVIKWK